MKNKKKKTFPTRVYLIKYAFLRVAFDWNQFLIINDLLAAILDLLMYLVRMVKQINVQVRFILEFHFLCFIINH